MEGRNQVFQTLKPACVALSEAALALNSSRANTSNLALLLERLSTILDDIIEADPTSLDHKLADYVFFPLSQVLKASQKISIRCLELSFHCLAVLLEHGWRAKIQSQLAGQVLILCTLMAEREPKGLNVRESTDDLQRHSLDCLRQLFNCLNISVEGRGLLALDANTPQLGQTISVVLTVIADGRSPSTQIVAAETLLALQRVIQGSEVAAGFLPGTVSKLSKILQPQSNQRRNPKVLVICIETLAYLLENLVCDDLIDRLNAAGRSDASNITVNAKWLRAASEQLKPVLAGVLRLRTHSRHDVRDSIAALCFVLIENCRRTLANCSQMALESLLILNKDAQSNDRKVFRLELLLRSEPSISALLQEILHDWLRTLPRTMQGANEQAKSEKLRQVTTAYDFLTRCDIENPVIGRLLSTALRDSIIVTIQLSGEIKASLGIAAVNPMQTLELQHLEGPQSANYGSALVGDNTQSLVFDGVYSFVQRIENSRNVSTFLPDVMRSLRQSDGDVQLANFWLAYAALSSKVYGKDDVDALMNLDGADFIDDDLEELYSLSLSILSQFDDAEAGKFPDPRLRSLALRTISLRAESVGTQFRYELVDALYPVLHALATPDAQLQRDSMVTLNKLTRACEYSSTQQLIVENVDYLTNAVTLKLNAFDVSPQAPQVLLMMVKLAGPSLLPYLEDTVDSIFAILGDYHGYDLLVELLFRALSAVAQEGTQTAELRMIEDGPVKDLLKSDVKDAPPITLSGLVDMVESMRKAEAEESRRRQDESTKPKFHPKRPWSEIQELDDHDSDSGTQKEDETQPDQDKSMDDTDPPPPAPRIYGLLLKITELTQHFLPSASASLRTSLLELIRTTVPAIAKHETSFLPLVNALWPEIVSRLDDVEPHIQTTSLQIVATLCEYAGDFMRSRIRELWPALLEQHQKLAKGIVHSQRVSTARPKDRKQETAMVTAAQLGKAVARMQISPADYVDTAVRIQWEAMVDLITMVVRTVPLTPQMFDEALGMLEPVLERTEVRSVLEASNADAVWLVLVRLGREEVPEKPSVPEGTTWTFVEVK